MKPGADIETRLALVIVQRIAAQLGIGTLDPPPIDAPAFGPDGYRVGRHPVSSIEMIEFLVLLEQELGIRLLNPETLADVCTIRDLAAMINARADRLAVRRFCLDR
jgi:hypothetical protein